MERKLIESKMKIFTGLLLILFIILLGRLGFMQIIEAKRYQTLATQNHQRLITVTAPRGEIFDRNGVRIVSNKPIYTISFVYLGLEDTMPVIKRLSALLEGDGSFNGMNAKQIEQDIQERIKDNKRLYEPVRIAAKVSQETVNRIEEQRLELPGVNIDIEPVRYYPFGDLMGEVLGYVREITNEQLVENRIKGYHMGDSFGQVGLENFYEEYLRGEKGARQVEVDAQGRPVRDLGFKQPVSGNNLILSIDHRLQRVAQNAVVSAIEQARYLGYSKVPAGKSVTGTAVVTDVHTGEILAMASVPSYDLNLFSGPLSASKYNQILNSGALRNHAIQTTYSPGSTFKMATASAFLEENIVDAGTVIYDPGYYKYKKSWKLDGHGFIDVVKALKYSSDTFFYMFGVMAGPELMGKYALEYGLGMITGVDLPGEEAGRLASREVKKKMWSGNEWESQWREYDSMDMAIGQQENKFTAIQLANFVSAIANGGTIYRPQMVKRIIGIYGTELKNHQPEVIKNVGVSKETIEIMQKGMREVAITDGTAAGIFWGVPYTVAAKTGTAEVGDAAKNNHAIFVAYAPYEKPEIAISVIIEYGGKGGAIAGPVARKILDAYFSYQKTTNEEIPIERPQQVQRLNRDTNESVRGASSSGENNQTPGGSAVQPSNTLPADNGGNNESSPNSQALPVNGDYRPSEVEFQDSQSNNN